MRLDIVSSSASGNGGRPFKRYAGQVWSVKAISCLLVSPAACSTALLRAPRLAANDNVSEFIREANQTVDDLNAQEAAARLEVERQRDTNRQIPRVIAIVSIAAALIMAASWLIGTLT